MHTATTDPFLPQVKESTFRLLELLEQRRLTNDVMIITKYYLTREDIERLETFRNSNILLLLTFNSNPAEIEPTGASKAFAQKRWDTLELLDEHAQPRCGVITTAP
jgi:DNA repair photolyase